MTTTQKTPREEVESFIKDMIASFDKYRSKIEKVNKDSWTHHDDKAALQADSKKYWAKRNRLDKKSSDLVHLYYNDRAEVLKKHGIPVPSDFFSALLSGCIYDGDEIEKEVVVNKNTVKIFTRGKTYIPLKIFVVQMQDGKWQITKLRELNEKTQKDSHLDW